jgi:16S rRNA processing protein RimM
MVTLTGRIALKGIIVKIKGIASREAAGALKGQELAVLRSDLPAPDPDEYYQADLLGLEALRTDGKALGRVVGFLEPGEVLVLVAKDDLGRETLIPFTESLVPEVDLAGGWLKVANVPGLFPKLDP